MSGKSDRVCRIISLLLAVVNGLALPAMVLGGLRVRGRFLAIYKDLFPGLSLPAVTRFVVSVPAWAVFGVAYLLLGVLVAKEFIRPRWVPLCLNLAWMLAGVMVAVMFAVALMAPFITIMQHMTALGP
jgi:hypothetical protein